MIAEHLVPQRSARKTNLRLQIVFVVIGIFVLAIIARLFVLQILNHDYYVALAAGQHQLYEKLVPKRGRILVQDQNHQLTPLADNQSLYLVYAVPNIIEDPDTTARNVAALLGVEETEPTPEVPTVAEEKKKKEEKPDQGVILDSTKAPDVVNVTFDDLWRRIHKGDDKYEALVRGVSAEKAKVIDEADIEGIRLQAEEARYYPENSLAAQILGFYGYKGDEKVGSYGIEGYFDEQLRGTEGSLSAERDTAGRFISIGNKEIVPAKNGTDIVLTIDKAVQYKAEELAKMAKDKYLAEEASIIVTEPKTGKIRAMANYPTFNVNEYGKVEDAQTYQNSVISDVFEPGSIFKPVMMAAGIDAGLVEPNTTYINTGTVKVGKYTIENVDRSKSGVTTMTEVLERSLNTGMVFVMQKLGREKSEEYIHRFGFDQPTGITLEGEGTSLIQPASQWSDPQLANIGFGQGIATTELHMAQAMGAIANNGQMMQPQIVEEFRNADGTGEIMEPKVIGQPISTSTALKVSAMLVSSTEHGFAKAARIPGYQLAAKTGTAQVAVNGNYNNNSKIVTYEMFGPVDDPKFLFIVKLVNPGKGRFSEDTAAPISKLLVQFLIDYYRIPPTSKP